jgi:hypothetical protein
MGKISSPCDSLGEQRWFKSGKSQTLLVKRSQHPIRSSMKTNSMLKGLDKKWGGGWEMREQKRGSELGVMRVKKVD